MKRSLFVLLLPHLVLTLLLLGVTQFIFLESSFHKDLGLGVVDKAYTLSNYVAIFQDSIYVNSLKLTIFLSVSVVLLSLIVTYPAAYVLARINPKVASVLLTAIVASSFLSGAIKILGLVIIFGSNGPINQLLRATGLSDGIQLMGTVPGVVVGYIYLSIGFTAMMLYATLQTIPVRLEEAAQVHGASRWRTYLRVVVPLSLPGVMNTALTEFNLLMGAFVIAAILGGGKIITFPVLIQRTLMMYNDYGMAAALSAVLLVLVLAVNILGGFAAGNHRLRERLA